MLDPPLLSRLLGPLLRPGSDARRSLVLPPPSSSSSQEPQIPTPWVCPLGLSDAHLPESVLHLHPRGRSRISLALFLVSAPSHVWTFAQAPIREPGLRALGLSALGSAGQGNQLAWPRWSGPGLLWSLVRRPPALQPPPGCLLLTLPPWLPFPGSKEEPTACVSLLVLPSRPVSSALTDLCL